MRELEKMKEGMDIIKSNTWEHNVKTNPRA